MQWSCDCIKLVYKSYSNSVYWIASKSNEFHNDNICCNQRRNISNYTLLKMIDVQIILLVSLVRWVTQKKLLMLSLMSQMMIAKLMRMRAHYPNAKIHYSVNIFFLWDVFFFQKHPKPLWIFPSFFTMLLNGKMSSSEKTDKKGSPIRSIIWW